ncbi:heterokaryon incompatibility protein-domain-containing protein [Chaetomium tenue]|uniref:Heterokaryon incompatibility protein-domain-containing protein n=1 Tax=Chaetomium tenue TaxID=1854479 RepID=A0ACB7P9B3_9PEZI|nr:heterokaryon incompatibility protein-domain-containing protein [Chaetomium globosum]
MVCPERSGTPLKAYPIPQHQTRSPRTEAHQRKRALAMSMTARRNMITRHSLIGLLSAYSSSTLALAGTGSYVWGGEAKTASVCIDDSILRVTENLGAALRDLRKADQPRTLWADAICINQAEEDFNLEKNHQVGMMDDIYRSACRTVIWLGPGVKGDTDKAYDMLEELAAEAISREHSTNVSSILSGNLTISLLDRKLVESPLYERYEDQTSIVHLADSAWWSRAWTVQEILLASQAVVVTGSRSMEWQRLCKGVDYGFAIGIWLTLIIGQVVDPTVMPYLSMRALTQVRKHPSDALSMQASNVPVPTQDMLRMLIHCRFRKATNPRDKVYALLRLVTDENLTVAPLGFEPDYTAPTSVVYTDAAKNILLRSNNLDLFGACSPSTMDGLPSWAPDWSITTPAPRPLMDDAFGSPRKTHASAGTHQSPQFLSNPNTPNPSNPIQPPLLLLTGHALTTVTALTPTLHRLQINIDAFTIPAKRQPTDTLFQRLARLGRAFSVFAELYAQLSAVVPQVGILAEWEAFARAEGPMNPVPAALTTTPTGEGAGEGMRVGMGYDPLAVYRRTLGTGRRRRRGCFISGGRICGRWRGSMSVSLRG